jgi:hypothetical protein
MSKKSQLDHKMVKEKFLSNCRLENINGEIHSVALEYSDSINPFDSNNESVRFERFKRFWKTQYQNHLYFEDVFDVMGGRPMVVEER